MPLRPDELRAHLRETGAWLEGHFRLTTGLHSPEFFLLARLLQYPWLAERCGRGLAELVSGLDVHAVVGPAMGGVLLAHEVARALGVRSLFAERDGERMRLRRGFQLNPGEPVLLVEDAVTTGGSVRRTAAAVREAGGRPVAIAAIVDRSGGRVTFDVPFRALLTVDVPSYPPSECPLCAQGIPLVEPKQ